MKQLWQTLFKKITVGQRMQVQYVSANALREVEQKVNATPSLPVPSLKQTLEKYLRSVTPFSSEADLELTKNIIENFSRKNGAGEELQELLVKRAKGTNNWLAEWWLDTAYLGYRDPLVVFSSPGLVWPHTVFQNVTEQLVYTSNLISAALEFNEKIEKDLIPQEMSGKDPLCMLQYKKIFGTHRIPKKPKDLLQLQDPQNVSRNIIVLFNNSIFSVDVFEQGSRKPLSAGHFLAILKDIVEQGSGDSGPGLGVLTTENRDNWADVYEELKKDETNRRNLEEYVEKALFVVCVDQHLDTGKELHSNTKCSKLLLHGFGGSKNGSNRWFDKTVQFIVGAGCDGVGVAYEHSPAEGGPIGVLTDFVHYRLKDAPKELEPQTNYTKPKKLSFTISPAVSAAISLAKKRLDCLNEDLEVIGLTFPYFGKNRLKTAKISPDSFIQVAIQYAFYKTHKQPAAQYESGTLRKFTEGRTDIIRTCSQEVVDFCKTMTDRMASPQQKHEALRKAIQAHKEYATEVINGRGVDRHLLGLKLLAQANDMALPDIFMDKSYKKSTYFQLSTSNVPTKCDGFMVYGPLVKDGYACCYNPRDESINFGTSAWRTCSYTDLNEFVSNLEQGLLEMESCLNVPALNSKL
ncbi:UNVERIFIED_CONTAM: hypothetical protein PYX00_006752 [Menopon gallinae]|uniref:Choline/carnitine acyltransferase domain-containing protein n=2 Tax=Menopon gallinae TaxID=328185 RepID=A0AAW2HWY0_9NEOP